MESQFTVKECHKCEQAQLYHGPCTRKGCETRGTRIRTIKGMFKIFCGKHTPCCKGKGVVIVPLGDAHNPPGSTIEG